MLIQYNDKSGVWDLVYRMKTQKGTFYYDPTKENIFESITVDGSRQIKQILVVKLMSPWFVDNKGQPRKLPKDKEIFFREFLPRTMRLKGKVEKLDDDNVIFTDDSILYKENDNRMVVINFQDIKGSRFYYNTREFDLNRAFWVDGPERLKEMFKVMLKAPKFLANDRELHFTNIERKLFFNEYIPRVFGTPSKTGTIEIVEI